MNKRYKDTDLREALHRKYADTPQLPADFMAKMEHRMAERQAAPSGSAAGAKRVRLWRWVAAAACFRLYIINNRYRLARPVFRLDTSSCSIEHAQSVNRARSISQSSTLSCSIEHAQSVNRARSINQSSTSSCSIGAPQSSNRGASVAQSGRPNPPIEAPQSSNRGAPITSSGRHS